MSLFKKKLEETAEKWRDKGIALGKMSKYREALECFDKALKIDPNNPIIWNNKAAVFISLNRFPEATMCTDYAVILECLAKIERAEKAGAPDHVPQLREPSDLDNLKISHDPREKMIQTSKKIMENVELDMKVLERIAKENPIDPCYQDIKNSKEFKLRYMVTTASMEGEYEKAIEYANKGLEINPKSVYLIYMRGKSKGNACRFKEGIEDINKAIKLDPNFGIALAERGYIKLKMGDIEGAKEDVKKARKIMEPLVLPR
jgi:tetratricopeptide (TPR) repeat protein